MARFSKHKPLYLNALQAAIQPLIHGASIASRLDQIAVDHAARALAYAVQWTMDGAEVSRGPMREQTALLENAAKDSKTRLGASLFAYAQALRAFAQNDYASVAKFADMSRKA